MNPLLCTWVVVQLAVATIAQPPASGDTATPAAAGEAVNPAAGDTNSRLLGSALEKLNRSTAQLNALRESIAGEKVPLSEELNGTEQKLVALRRDLDQLTRARDAGDLDVANIRAETKARQDELGYVANLLDEYIRAFDAKMAVGEAQRYGAAIDTAKHAGEDKNLGMSEKFDRQAAFVQTSLARAFDAIGGMRFDGIAVDPEGSVSEGQFAVIGPVSLFRGKSGVSGLVVAQTGSTKPLVRPLEGAAQAGIAQLVEQGEGSVPLDPSRGGALKALVQKTNLFHIFEKGGPIMWPLLAASILALGTVLERLLFLGAVRRRRDPRKSGEVLGALENGDMERAIALSHGSKDYVVRAMNYALEHRQQSLSSALMYAQAQELKRFRRGVSILDTVITLAPLLGLLGTVTGMMGSFSLIGGELSAPGAITGGIAEALIATAFGLGIAITCLLPFNYLNTRTEDARHELESAASQVELLLHPHAAPMHDAARPLAHVPTGAPEREPARAHSGHHLHPVGYPQHAPAQRHGHGHVAPALDGGDAIYTTA